MYCDAQVGGVSHINSYSLQLLFVTIRNEKFLNFGVQRGYKKDDAWNEFSILPQVMNTELVVKAIYKEACNHHGRMGEG